MAKAGIAKVGFVKIGIAKIGAEKIGIARSSLSEYLSGKKRPSLTTFENIESALRKMESQDD